MKTNGVLKPQITWKLNRNTIIITIDQDLKKSKDAERINLADLYPGTFILS